MVWTAGSGGGMKRLGSGNQLVPMPAAGTGDKGSGNKGAVGNYGKQSMAMVPAPQSAYSGKGGGNPWGHSAGYAAMALPDESMLLLAGRQAKLGKGKGKVQKPKAKKTGTAYGRTKQATADSFPDSMNRIISMGRGELREARVSQPT